MAKDYTPRQALRDCSWVAAPCAVIGVFLYTQGFRRAGLAVLVVAGAIVVLGLLTLISSPLVAISAYIGHLLWGNRTPGSLFHKLMKPGAVRDPFLPSGAVRRERGWAGRIWTNDLRLVLFFAGALLAVLLAALNGPIEREPGGGVDQAHGPSPGHCHVARHRLLR